MAVTSEDRGKEILCCVNPTLNSHPEAAPPFLEARAGQFSENQLVPVLQNRVGSRRDSGRTENTPWFACLAF
jgi:hypothetical protein